MFRFTKPVARKHERRHMRRAGWLTLDGHAAPIPCVVWDMSAGGCRLAAPHAVHMPQIFVLAMGPADADRYHCRMVWQRGAYVGAKFIEAAEAERLGETLPDHRPGGKSLYLNNDLAHFSNKKKPADKIKRESVRDRSTRRWSRMGLY
jgi:hypothetical protein